jgi:DNA-binding transcriptional LysR family regulator
VELRHLRAFVVLAEELNFTRAAARLHVVQQALSTQIRSSRRTSARRCSRGRRAAWR